MNNKPDHEVSMARADLYKIAEYAIKLHRMLEEISEEQGIEGWMQSKITKASDYVSSVYHTLSHDMKFGEGDDLQVEAYGRYDRRDAYQRDYDHSVAGMGKRQSRAYQDDGGANDERHDLDPTDWYFVKDGKMFAISVYPNQEREAIARGYSRTRSEAKAKASNEGVAEGSTTRGGFGGSAGQAQHEIEWLKKKISSLPPTKEKQIRDLQRQIRERELAIAFQKKGVAEGYPKHQDLSGISTEKLKAYLAKQSQQQVSGEGNQVKRVRAELQRREELNFGNIDDEEENQWWIDYDMKEGVAENKKGVRAAKHTVKPRNFVAKNAVQSGAGAHKDKKKAAKQGDTKHKATAYENRLESALQSALMEKAPKGWEGTVKAMKKHDEIENPYALAHYMKNKGYKSHKKK
jgi:hypothetical protein